MRKGLLGLLIACSLLASAQVPISKIEYFLDVDPGRGLGTDVPVSPSADVDLPFLIPAAALTEGFHVLTVRTRDQNLVWGLPESSVFFVSTSSVQLINSIDGIEYFIDDDPGQAGGTLISVTPGMSVDELFNVPTAGLTKGFHVLSVRARDEQSQWSLVDSKVFYVDESTTSSSNLIDKLEYFVDVDPGPGSGQDVPITPGMTLDNIYNLPTSGLAKGFHVVSFRARDNRGQWSLMESKVFFVDESSTLTDNAIDKLEYFIDADPGRGSGQDIPITSNSNIDHPFTVPTSGLTKGFHSVTLRARDVRGQWSLSESKVFYVDESTTLFANIVDKLEYFIDTDPGPDSGQDIPITPGITLDHLFNVATSSLSKGIHIVGIRARDSRGQWSVVERKAFFVDESTTIVQNDIVELELFIDSDPGRGDAYSLPITAGPDIDITENLDIDTLASGLHIVSVRALDNRGQWSQTESKVFFISASASRAQNNLVGYEYFFDDDPGYGKGIFNSTTPGMDVFLIDSLNTDNLLPGMHTISIRMQDDQGGWGQIETKAFYLEDQRRITLVEYAIDIDPGQGAGQQVQILPSEHDLTDTLYIPTDTLSIGLHKIYVRVYDNWNSWSLTDSALVSICDGATPDFTVNTVCQGDTTFFIDQSLNVQAGDVFSWDFDGDGIVDSNLAGDESFVFGSPGTYQSTLSIDRAGCIGITTVIVTVEPPLMAAAGVDQLLCSATTMLAGNALGPNESGVWTIISGVGTLVDPTIANAQLNNIQSSSVSLSWTVTNTLGGCQSTDTVNIVPNLPLSSSDSTVTVTIGQIISNDVRQFAASNPNDVLSTSITSSPLHGNATINTNGEIEYTPFADAPSSDSLVYEVCNQCNNCVSQQLNYSIDNSSPTIQAYSGSHQNQETITIDLLTLIADVNDNLDISSIRIVNQPLSGAFASIDGNGVLTIDYTGIEFQGEEVLSIEVCDLSGACVTQELRFDVDIGSNLEDLPITVYNAISPNGDGIHDFLEIENIEFYPNNTVFILNRWGSKVATFDYYDNQSNVFTGQGLPAGVYYYNVISSPGAEPLTGHFVLKSVN